MQTAGSMAFCQEGTDKKRGDEIAPCLLSQLLYNPAKLHLLRHHPYKTGATQHSASSLVDQTSYLIILLLHYMLDLAPCQATNYA